MLNSIENPNKRSFFTQIEILEKIYLSKDKPGISHILSNITEPEIVSIRVIKTISGQSQEGVELTGLKAALEVLIREKILYVSVSPEQTTHIIEHEFYKMAYVTLPDLIEGTDPEYLVTHKYLKPLINVEDTSLKPIDQTSILNSINLNLQLYLVSTYEICYSIQHGKTGSLFISHGDLSKERQLLNYNNHQCLKPEWSPNGQDIAFLRDSYGNYLLHMLNIKKMSELLITDPSIFESITGFTWSPDGFNIAFTAVVEGFKEIFMTNIKTLEHRRLTSGNSLLNSFKPRISPDGKKVAYLRSYGGLTDLYIMDSKGLNSKGLTALGNIKDFCWCPDGSKIAIVSTSLGGEDELIVISPSSSVLYRINELSTNYQKKKVKFSPDSKLLSFVGSYLDTDNLYLFDMINKNLIPVTDNHRNVIIDSFTWSIDSSKIFYSSNQYGNPGIYSIDVKSFDIHHLKTLEGSSVYISYRPQIK